MSQKAHLKRWVVLLSHYFRTLSLSRLPGESYGKLSVRQSRLSWLDASVTSLYQISNILVNQRWNCATRRLALSVTIPGSFEKSRISLFNPRSILFRTWLPNSSYPVWCAEHVSLLKNFAKNCLIECTYVVVVVVGVVVLLVVVVVVVVVEVVVLYLTHSQSMTTWPLAILESLSK